MTSLPQGPTATMLHLRAKYAADFRKKLDDAVLNGIDGTQPRVLTEEEEPRQPRPGGLDSDTAPTRSPQDTGPSSSASTCEHECSWVEATPLGAPMRTFICTLCPNYRTEDWPKVGGWDA